MEAVGELVSWWGIWRASWRASRWVDVTCERSAAVVVSR